MIKNIVNSIKEQAEHIQGIKTFQYEGNDLINQQSNNSTIQVIVEDNIYSEYNLSKDLIRIHLNIDILDTVFQEQDKLDIHDNTFIIGIVLMKLISFNYREFINVSDLSLIPLSRFTDDELYGQRLSMTINIPSPINNCNINEYINLMNKYEEKVDNEITIKNKKIDISNIDINPIKLKKNG